MDQMESYQLPIMEKPKEFVMINLMITPLMLHANSYIKTENL